MCVHHIPWGGGGGGGLSALQLVFWAPKCWAFATGVQLPRHSVAL